jgi:DNA repair protein RadC
MKIEDSQPMNIKSWSPEDRPREKLLSKGISSLSDAELIAILIGSGTAKLSAVDVAKRVLAYVENNLDSLAKLSVKELMKAKGIGEAKAIAIVAALELGRRRKDQSPDEKPKIGGSKTAFDLIKGDLMDLPNEEFWVILLNRANRMIRKKRVSEGGVSGTVVDPKIIFKLAVDELASGIIVVHNHPSGNSKPSESDINLTKKIKEAGKVLEIALLDHLIIAHDRYFSFADEGLI